MTSERLTAIFMGLLEARYPGRKLRLAADFYPARSLRHTIERRFNTVTVRIAEPFRSVPEDVIRLLALILLSKLFRHKIQSDIRQAYNAYVNTHILPHYPVRSRSVSRRYISAGKYYDLGTLFDRLNHAWFDGRLTRPQLGWSLNRSYARLGFYSRERNLLVISRIFDSGKVPQRVVEFLLYHEMLHIFLPPREKNGRKYSHTKEFRRLEKQFPEFTDIERWIKKHLHRL